ncbi:MAG TPA: GAF domain-containing sensor histidine kinase [Capillimicrobium sp.]|nr:GAF domain-containing sensor histidine kinase [Capillimicrobium sp.]
MLDQARLRRVLEVGRALVSDLDLESVLQRVLEEARDLTGARYAAMGVLDARKQELERFITIGAPPEVHQAVGDLPRGRGVLGVLIQDPQLLRLHNVSDHPRSFGFPVGHPPMQSFLGVPVLVRGEAWGNLYLTDKEGADDFDEDDEDAIELLASWAGIAIDNARAYQAEQERRLELEAAVRALEATTAIARALGGETDLDRILELISKRARALVDARSVLILLDEGDELVIRAWAGDAPRDVDGLRLRIDASISGDVLRSGRPERAGDLSTRVRFQLGDTMDAQKGLFVPLVFRGRALGVLEAFDRHDGRDFSDDDERLMLSFAASAATAVATAQSAANEALRRSLAASERERQRWARELHDETLQQLAGLKVLLSGARRRDEVDKLHEVLEVAVDQIDESITDLRRLVTDLRPAALDDLGLPAALEGLVERVAETAGLKATLRVSLDGAGRRDDGDGSEDGRGARRLPTAVEDSAYRIVQEALTNVVKHAAASRVDVVIEGDQDRLELRVSDDGKGFDPEASSSGFGLVGMRERVDLLGGTIEIEPQERRGTTIHVTLPLDGAPATGLHAAAG